MSDQQAGGTSAKKLIIPALLLILAILVFLGWRGVFSPTLPGAPGSANAPYSDAPLALPAPAMQARQRARRFPLPRRRPIWPPQTLKPPVLIPVLPPKMLPKLP